MQATLHLDNPQMQCRVSSIGQKQTFADTKSPLIKKPQHKSHSSYHQPSRESGVPPSLQQTCPPHPTMAHLSTRVPMESKHAPFPANGNSASLHCGSSSPCWGNKNPRSRAMENCPIKIKRTALANLNAVCRIHKASIFPLL